MYSFINHTPTLGETLFVIIYGNEGERLEPVQVLEVFPAVCVVRSIKDQSTFRVHVALLRQRVGMSDDARSLHELREAYDFGPRHVKKVARALMLKTAAQIIAAGISSPVSVEDFKRSN